MIYQYGVVDGYGFTWWGARTYEEALRWHRVKYADPKLNALEVVWRENN